MCLAMVTVHLAYHASEPVCPIMPPQPASFLAYTLEATVHYSRPLNSAQKWTWAQRSNCRVKYTLDHLAWGLLHCMLAAIAPQGLLDFAIDRPLTWHCWCSLVITMQQQFTSTATHSRRGNLVHTKNPNFIDASTARARYFRGK